jgi:asparagine synthetase B (glutamine-hydrolysing)
LDLKRQKLILSTDIFGTKPLWLASTENNIGVASYQSSLTALAYRDVRQIPPNTTLVIDLKNYLIEERLKIHSFDLRQFKDTYEDWVEAFGLSIQKRAAGLREKLFIGLSGGYDSGAIACELLRQNIEFHSYSLAAKENVRIISDRMKYVSNGVFINLSKEEYSAERKFLRKNSEPYSSPPSVPHRPKGYVVLNDHGAVGTGVICRLARRDGCKIYLSGQGADEIMSDYGFRGVEANGCTHTDLRGHYPADLRHVFPWTNFYAGTQREFLYKDEAVGGSYGIECRYPYLDKNLVQEFLWLSQELKNRQYKAPLAYYLSKFNFPFAEGLANKVGFCANYFNGNQRRTEGLLRRKWRGLFQVFSRARQFVQANKAN